MNRAGSDDLQNVIQVLVEQRDITNSNGASFAGHLIDLAIVQLRLTLHGISEDELSQFSNFLRGGVAEGGRPE